MTYDFTFFEPPKPKLPDWRWFVPAVILMTLLIMLVFMATGVFADEPKIPSNLWQGLLAEATSDGYDGLFAVACVVRHRLALGMDNGLVGLKRRNLGQFCLKEGHKREVMVKKIVKQVFFEDAPDTTRGATHYESIKFKKPYWAYKMQKTCQIGEHIFYK